MNYRYFIVKDINSEEKFDCKLPLVYAENGYLAKLYLRTQLFDSVDFGYRFIELEKVPEYTVCSQSTETVISQPFDRNITDATYDKYVDTTNYIMHKNSCVVTLSDLDIECCDDDIHQAIFEQLLFQLEVDFYINYKK